MEIVQFRYVAVQVHSVYLYERLKIKVLKCNADIFFNKQCLFKKIVPKYANMKFPTTSPAALRTKSTYGIPIGTANIWTLIDTNLL